MKIKDKIANQLRSIILDGEIEKWISVVLQSIIVGIFMGYVAIKNNPQEEYISIESRTLDILNLLEIVTPWIVGTMIFCTIINGISILLIRSLRSVIIKK